jgi:16S rRNA (adenine1518-N6/adenine1519-N6)-dimethyltransferase
MAHSVRAKKHLGQHFLNDENIAKKIVDAVLEENSPNALIEIGPGTGVLTKHLIHLPNFWALDIDTESIEFLRNTYPEHLHKIVEGDFSHTISQVRLCFVCWRTEIKWMWL